MEQRAEALGIGKTLYYMFPSNDYLNEADGERAVCWPGTRQGPAWTDKAQGHCHFAVCACPRPLHMATLTAILTLTCLTYFSRYP